MKSGDRVVLKQSMQLFNTELYLRYKGCRATIDEVADNIAMVNFPPFKYNVVSFKYPIPIVMLVKVTE